MNTTCPRCMSIVAPGSSFCTNCGAVLAPQPQPPYSQPSQVPPWASTTPGTGYSSPQQQISGGSASNGGSLGFGGQNDALAKKVITWIALGIGITLVLVVLFGLLAFFVPGLRCLFLVFLLVIILVPVILYNVIRNYVRRTVGRLWWFL